MIQFVFDPVALGWSIAGLVLGLLIGRIAWGGRRRAVVVADSAAQAAARSAAEARADQVSRELAGAQAAMRPLADEVDRLKRELARAQRPVQEPSPGSTAMTSTAATPTETMPPVSSAGGSAVAVGGTGPIVVAAPDIRQLKGVGDKFAAALSAIGLTSVDQIARLTPDEAVDADGRIGVFNGRIARDQLVDQATLLDEGRTTEYEARFGKLGGPVLV